jgi:hypothetical protein
MKRATVDSSCFYPMSVRNMDLNFTEPRRRAQSVVSTIRAAAEAGHVERLPPVLKARLVRALALVAQYEDLDDKLANEVLRFAEDALEDLRRFLTDGDRT